MLWTALERLNRIDPWREFEKFERMLNSTNTASNGEFPAANLWVSGDMAVITTEIPGVDPAKFDISVVGKSITLKGSRGPEQVEEEETHHRRERWHGQFTRTFELPFSVDADKVSAKYSKGILKIDLPRAEAEKPRRIEIK